MQSEPTEVTQKTSQDLIQDTQTSSQYGHHDSDDPAAPSRRDGRQAADRPTPARRGDVREDASTKTPEQDAEQDFDELQRRVSSTSSRRTGSPVDRIIEHEETIVPAPKRKNNGPSFTVVRSKTTGSPSLNLTDFPNGSDSKVEWHCGELILCNRGSHPHPVAPPADNVV